MKEFLNEMKPKRVKKMDKVELSDIILDYQNDVIEFYVKKGHLQKVAPVIDELFTVLNNKKVAKAFKDAANNLFSEHIEPFMKKKKAKKAKN